MQEPSPTTGMMHPLGGAGVLQGAGAASSPMQAAKATMVSVRYCGCLVALIASGCARQTSQGACQNAGPFRLAPAARLGNKGRQGAPWRVE